MNKISFPCSVAQIKTLADGGIRLMLDLPEDSIRETAILLECKRQSIPLLATFVADEDSMDDGKKLVMQFDPDTLFGNDKKQPHG